MFILSEFSWILDSVWKASLLLILVVIMRDRLDPKPAEFLRFELPNGLCWGKLTLLDLDISPICGEESRGVTFYEIEGSLTISGSC